MTQIIEPPPIPEPYQIRRGNLVTSDITYGTDNSTQTSAPTPFAYTVKNVSGGYSLELSDFSGFVMIRADSGNIIIPDTDISFNPDTGAAVLISSSNGPVTIVSDNIAIINSANGNILQQYERVLLIKETDFDVWGIAGLSPVGS